MIYKKQISIIDENIIRVVCIPEDEIKCESTFAVQNPDIFKTVMLKKSGGYEIYSNSALTVKISQDGKNLNRQNLTVEWSSGEHKKKWSPGDLDNENLGGPFQSLDLAHEKHPAEGIIPYDPMKGFDSYKSHPTEFMDSLMNEVKKIPGISLDDEPWLQEWRNFVADKPPALFKKLPDSVMRTLDKIKKFPPGFLSRSGVSFILDDSPAFDEKANWIREDGKRKCEILYIIQYGKNFKKALHSLTRIFGKIPVVPEWLLGIWYSCYLKMGEKEYKKVKEDFDKQNLPLDVVVVDTDWHKYFWHGFDWNKKLFPDPDRFAEWLKGNNLYAAFNVHPQFIPEKDSRLDEFLKRSKTEKDILDKKRAQFRFFAGCQKIDLFNKKQALDYFKVFHTPIEKLGCYLWWIDGTLKQKDGKDATPWLNEMYALNTNKRPDLKPGIVLSRAQGLGAHRSTLLFTGDTYSQWAVLKQEVEMTSKASNTLMAYVSHDIGGFIYKFIGNKKNQPPDDLYLRWVQFGCLSPVFRLHSDHGIRQPWKYKKRTLQSARMFFHLRKTLRRYLQQLSKEANLKGIGLCRPMYYEFPDEEAAYKYNHQYMLGEAILVSPVVSDDAVKETWIPPGRWSHVFKKCEITGPAVIREAVPDEYIPVYVREGYDIEYFPAAHIGKIKEYNVDQKIPFAEVVGITPVSMT